MEDMPQIFEYYLNLEKQKVINIYNPPTAQDTSQARPEFLKKDEKSEIQKDEKVHLAKRKLETGAQIE